MTTYGQLMLQAAHHVHEGAAQTQAHPFSDRAEAHLAVASFHGLLDAIERHVWHLVDPRRASTIYGTNTPADGMDPVEYAALRMVTAIPTLEDRDHRLPPVPATIDHPWAHAAREIGTATDLLATHTDARGISRSPDGPTVWNFDARRTALARLADLTGAVLSGSDTLGLRVGQTGVHWSNVRRWLPGFDEARAWAAYTVHRSRDRSGSGPLDDIGLANAPVRTSDSLTELCDRISRLRRCAWGSLSHPDFSVATLHDIAGVALAVNAHCAAIHGVDLRQIADHPELAHVPQVAHARAWQHVLGDLHDVFAPGPGDPTVHADAGAIRRLLADEAPLLPATTLQITRRDIEHRPVGEVLNGAVDAMAQIASWNAISYDRLARSGHARIRSANLSGELITDLPEYAAAKLRGTSVPVPPPLLERTLEHYRAAARPITNVPHGAHLPSPARTTEDAAEPHTISPVHAT